MKNYPTEVHRILDLEPDEDFGISVLGDNKYHLDESCTLISNHGLSCNPAWVVALINQRTMLIRLPRLTPEQVEHLKAAQLLGFVWVAKDQNGKVVFTTEKPRFTSWSWISTGTDLRMPFSVLSPLLNTDECKRIKFLLESAPC